MRLTPLRKLTEDERGRGTAQNAVRARRYAADILDIICLAIDHPRPTPTILARRLNDLGVRTRMGKPWTRLAVARLLKAYQA